MGPVSRPSMPKERPGPDLLAEIRNHSLNETERWMPPVGQVWNVRELPPRPEVRTRRTGGVFLYLNTDSFRFWRPGTLTSPWTPSVESLVPRI